MNSAFIHVPVMADEIDEAFAEVPDGVIVDATVGGAGHAERLLIAHPHSRLVGIDRDPDAVAASRVRLERFGARAVVHHARFDAIGELLATGEQEGAVAVLFDLGVSSPQLDRADRGFSFNLDGPIDMRMDPTKGRSGGDLVNEESLEWLTQLFIDNGETRFGGRIAKAIVEHRPLTSTRELADLVERVIPRAARRRGHPARRIFQALRIATNEEIDLLRRALDMAIGVLVPRGRIAVLSYHSGEDRLVKERFAFAESGGCTCPPGLPCVCGATSQFAVLTRGAKLPSKREIERNPRSESGRLRIGERLEMPRSRRWA